MFKAALMAAFVINFVITPLWAQALPSDPTIQEQITANLVEGLGALQKQNYPEARTKCKIAQFLVGASARDVEYFEFRSSHGMASTCLAQALVRGDLGDACPVVKAGKDDFVEIFLMISGHVEEKKQLYPFSDMIDEAGIEAGCDDD